MQCFSLFLVHSQRLIDSLDSLESTLQLASPPRVCKENINKQRDTLHRELVHTKQFPIKFDFSTYFAIIPDELRAMAGIYFAGAKITRFDTHFYAFSIIFVSKLWYFVGQTFSRGEQFDVKRHITLNRPRMSIVSFDVSFDASFHVDVIRKALRCVNASQILK